MGHYRKKHKKLSTGKKILLGFLSYLGGPLTMIIYHVWLNKNPENFFDEIETFTNAYEQLRPYVDASDTCTICIGSYAVEYNGELCLLSKFMSVYAKNVPDTVMSAVGRVERLQIGNDMYYQFPIKKRFSKTAKATIIRAVLEYIAANYPNDRLYYDKSLPIGIAAVNFKSIEEFLDRLK